MKTHDPVRFMAHRALVKIEATPKGRVFASRKGICAGVMLHGTCVMFRRRNGCILMEVTNVNHEHWKREGYELDEDLAQRAAELLDSL